MRVKATLAEEDLAPPESVIQLPHLQDVELYQVSAMPEGKRHECSLRACHGGQCIDGEAAAVCALSEHCRW